MCGCVRTDRNCVGCTTCLLLDVCAKVDLDVCAKVDLWRDSRHSRDDEGGAIG